MAPFVTGKSWRRHRCETTSRTTPQKSPPLPRPLPRRESVHPTLSNWSKHGQRVAVKQQCGLGDSTGKTHIERWRVEWSRMQREWVQNDSSRNTEATESAYCRLLRLRCRRASPSATHPPLPHPLLHLLVAAIACASTPLLAAREADGGAPRISPSPTSGGGGGSPGRGCESSEVCRIFSCILLFLLGSCFGAIRILLLICSSQERRRRGGNGNLSCCVSLADLLRWAAVSRNHHGWKSSPWVVGLVGCRRSSRFTPTNRVNCGKKKKKKKKPSRRRQWRRGRTSGMWRPSCSWRGSTRCGSSPWSWRRRPQRGCTSATAAGSRSIWSSSAACWSSCGCRSSRSTRRRGSRWSSSRTRSAAPTCSSTPARTAPTSTSSPWAGTSCTSSARRRTRSTTTSASSRSSPSSTTPASGSVKPYPFQLLSSVFICLIV